MNVYYENIKLTNIYVKFLFKKLCIRLQIITYSIGMYLI